MTYLCLTIIYLGFFLVSTSSSSLALSIWLTRQTLSLNYTTSLVCRCILGEKISEEMKYRKRLNSDT